MTQTHNSSTKYSSKSIVEFYVENTFFDLSNNNLVGEIPTSIGSMSSLRWLNLSGNQFEGSIPTSLSNISTLEVLDLAKNNLSGKIPQELSNLHWLRVLDVSCNNLCGPIPTGTQFSTFDVTSFQSNKCLWGCPIDRCSNQKENPMIEGNSTSNNPHVKVGWLSRVNENMSLLALSIGTGIGFGGVVAMFILWEKARFWVLALTPKKPQVFYGVYRLPT
jgi:Leucine-rich repeat (LRR) protein